MKYLDENITVTVSNMVIPYNSNNQYKIIDETDSVIFNGQTFIQGGTTSKVFDITSIVLNHIYINNFLSGQVAKPIIKKYKVTVINTYGEYTSEYETVYLAYRYSHNLSRLNRNISSVLSTDVMYNIQSGLIPTYPKKATSKYSVGALMSYDASTLFNIGGEWYCDYFSGQISFQLSKTQQFANVKIGLDTLINSLHPTEADKDINIRIVKEGEATIDFQNIKVGEFCNNLTGYYLMWQDRLGSVQSQHFAKNSIFSNSYNRSDMTNFKGNKRPIQNQVTSTWEINSDWISEEYYPNYESILVSPYLKLFDVEEDTVYDVVITDSEFTEKTFKNQGNQLFNLKLKLELDKKQNIVM